VPGASGSSAEGASAAEATAVGEPSDGRLVQAVLGGDGRAFELLVRRHDRRAFSLAFRLLSHREDAEDVVQESFVAALEALERFDVTRPFGPWFYRIVVNRSLNARKARSRRSTESIPEDAPASTPSPERAAEVAEARKTVLKALDSLTERQRHVVEMIELEGLSGPEVAEILGIPEGTVRWHLHSARKALRAALGPAEGGST
jgi:RNA polymerase sigma-70 factor (ECF subfamily)